MTTEWSRAAQRDLGHAMESHAKGKRSAGNYDRALRSARACLLQFPRSGRRVLSDNDREVRVLVVADYRLYYELSDNRLIVLRLIHQKMQADYQA